MERQLHLTMAGYTPDNPHGFTDGQTVYQPMVFGNTTALMASPGTVRFIEGGVYIDTAGHLFRESGRWFATPEQAALTAADVLESRGHELIARAETIRHQGHL